MGALTSLDVSSNNLGMMSSKEGWTRGDNGMYYSPSPGGGGQWDKPEEVEFKPFGVIALADAIPGMEALTSLNLSSNKLKAKGAKIVGEAIKVTNWAFAFILAPFPCPSDHWLNCCCLLLSTG
jgi:hypothetical protein